MNLWGHQNLVIIDYFSLKGKLITENLLVSPKYLRKWVVSSSSNASINHPLHPALFYQNMTLKIGDDTAPLSFDNTANSQAGAGSPNPGISANTVCRHCPKGPRKGTYGPSRPLNPVISHELRLRPWMALGSL